MSCAIWPQGHRTAPMSVVGVCNLMDSNWVIVRDRCDVTSWSKLPCTEAHTSHRQQPQRHGGASTVQIQTPVYHTLICCFRQTLIPPGLLGWWTLQGRDFYWMSIRHLSYLRQLCLRADVSKRWIRPNSCLHPQWKPCYGHLVRRMKQQLKHWVKEGGWGQWSG